MSLILLYHRVTDLQSDPQLLTVTPEHFEEHLRVLRTSTNPVRLDDLVRNLRQGTIANRDVALSFDDGYADNALEACPILGRYDFPATFFVTSALTNTNREFFWDELDRILLTPGRLPPTVSIGDYRAALKEAEVYGSDEFRKYASWNVLHPDFPTPRQRIYNDLAGLLHQSRVAQRETWLNELDRWAGLSNEGRQTHRMMTAQEMREIATRGLVAIGGHTIDHPVLSIENCSSQQHQIATNKLSIEKTIGLPVSGFSYPFGTRRDFLPETVSLVREAGYAFACANFTGRVMAHSDPFQLPRFIVRNWSGAEFEQRLTQWLTQST